MTRKKITSPNPWLSIPWDDYEDHMSSPEVQQAQLLSDIFGDALKEYQPKVVTVLGCSTGNGFENIDPAVTQKVVGVDINPKYLEVLQRRHVASLPNLKLICADLATLELKAVSCDLIYCGLVLEYVEPKALIGKITHWLNNDGKLIVVLQLPSKESKMVSETPYESLRRLEPIMKLVEPGLVRQMCAEVGLAEIKGYPQALDSTKSFFVGHYRKQKG